MKLLILFGVIFLFWCSVTLRLIVFNPFSFVFYALKDSFFYIKHKLYNSAPFGLVRCYCAPFGGGKTLSMVHDTIAFYNKYNNKPLYDSSRKMWVKQIVQVYSNVDFLTIPFQPFTSLGQIVDMQKLSADVDEKLGTRTVIIFCLDEASSQCNSRKFSSNFSPAVLSALLSCRHFRTNLFMTSQEFNMVDKLLREVCQRVVICRKWWRFVYHSFYSASVLEYASDPTIIKPIFRSGFLVKKDYDSYDTLSMVDELSHDSLSGDMLSIDEILAKRQPLISDVDDSKKIRRFRRRK